MWSRYCPVRGRNRRYSDAYAFPRLALARFAMALALPGKYRIPPFAPVVRSIFSPTSFLIAGFRPSVGVLSAALISSSRWPGCAFTCVRARCGLLGRRVGSW